jgi:tryptophan-rich sensory protein
MASILIAQLAGIIGSIFTFPNVNGWYKTLIKPDLTPPPWVFGPVWTSLYLLMGLAAFFIWQKREMPQARFALILYAIHLVLNALWSILFFAWKQPGWAFMEIVVLLGFILTITLFFWRLRPLAGMLMLPYIAWVSFATYLNFMFWKLN